MSVFKKFFKTNQTSGRVDYAKMFHGKQEGA